MQTHKITTKGNKWAIDDEKHDIYQPTHAINKRMMRNQPELNNMYSTPKKIIKLKQSQSKSIPLITNNSNHSQKLSQNELMFQP